MTSLASACLDLAFTAFTVIGGMLAFDAFKDLAARALLGAGDKR